MKRLYAAGLSALTLILAVHFVGAPAASAQPTAIEPLTFGDSPAAVNRKIESSDSPFAIKCGGYRCDVIYQIDDKRMVADLRYNDDRLSVASLRGPERSNDRSDTALREEYEHLRGWMVNRYGEPLDGQPLPSLTSILGREVSETVQWNVDESDDVGAYLGFIREEHSYRTVVAVVYYPLATENGS